MTGGSLKYAGRWLERLSNESPRGMIASQRKLVYRIRPIDLLCIVSSALHPDFVCIYMQPSIAHPPKYRNSLHKNIYAGYPYVSW